MNTKPLLTLVGAGPGDPELITLKGVKALNTADVVLYDALIDPILLQHAPKATHIYVGKRAGTHHASQQEINELIVTYATDNKHVVRLKGGDPMLFGRAQEEIDTAIQHNIPVNIVPGVSSAIGIPSYLGLPITSRGTNESVWITTGTTAKCTISQDIPLAAQSNATVIVLMGMSQLQNIVEVFLKYKPKDYPIAIIQNGTMPNEKKAVGTLETIISLVEQNSIAAPAIIIIGKAIK